MGIPYWPCESFPSNPFQKWNHLFEAGEFIFKAINAGERGMISDRGKQLLTMNDCRVVQVILASLFLCFLLSSPCGGASPEFPQDRPKRVLIIPSYNFNYLGSQWFLRGVIAEFTEHAPFKVNFLYENLQLAAKSSDQQFMENMAASLKIRYALEKPDLIIVQYKQVLQFMKQYGQEIFGPVPVVFSGLTAEGGYGQIELPGNYTGITVPFSSRKNIELILRNHPKVKKVYVVAGSSPIEQDLVNEAIKEGRVHNKNIEFIGLTNLSFSALLAQLDGIRGDSVIMYQMMLVDAEGKVFVPASAAVEIARSAHVPVYGMLDTYMGSGITGGFLIFQEGMGRRAAEIGTEILLGKGMPSVPLTTEPIASYRFDWRQLRRWGIDENDLPNGSTVEFKEFSLWDSYKWGIIGGICLILLQASLIVGLITNRFRRIEAERVLRESEGRYRAFFEEGPDGVVILNPENGQAIEFNDRACQQLGYSREEFAQLRVPDIDASETAEEVQVHIRKVMREGRDDFETRHRTKEGKIRHVQVTAQVIDAGKRSFYHCIWRDITDRKRAEDALRESERKYRELVENANSIILRWNPRAEITFLNEFGQKFFGYREDEILGRNVVGTITPDMESTGRDLRPLMKSICENPEAFEQNINENMLRDGRRVWIAWTNKAVFDSEGNLLEVLSVGTDITELRRAEEALRESEVRFRQMVESSPIAIGIATPGADIQYVNPKFQDIFGYTLEDIPRLDDWFSRAYPDPVYRGHIGAQWQAALEVAAPEIRPGVGLETQITCRDGSVRTMQIFGTMMADQVLAMFNDITEHKNAEIEKEKLQEQLLQAQKMESVGRLAGGLAHDFNNLLSVILGHAELALMKIKQGQPFYDRFKEIQAAAQRSAELTGQLLAFARKQTIAPKVLDLNATVEAMLKMMRRLIGEDIDLAWHPETGLWPIMMDPSQVDQILANLCVNARDAIAGVGKVTIETKNMTFDETYYAVHAGFNHGEYVMLVVSDNGCGMHKETLDKLFEPFFTTKGLGKGTGLGLATVYGIVMQNDGLINVYSEPGEGTTFKIYLPRYGGKALAANVEGTPKQLIRGHETILLVEDDLAILDMGRMMLEDLGYRVLVASLPGEAVRLAREHAGDIHLLITDLIMPEMNGRELAQNLLSLHPQIKSLLMSGYTANIIAHHGVLDEGIHFIQKPFSIPDLASKVREALDS
jgi:two-component system, cell cycle sensor histidine kinase and response regulator CckA